MMIEYQAEQLLESYLHQRVELVSCRHVVWNNGALGCPEPGKCTTMALVPGYEILFRCGDEIFSIHTNEHGSHFILATTPPVHLGR